MLKFCLHSTYYFTEQKCNKTIDNWITLSYHSQLDWKARVQKKKEGTNAVVISFSPPYITLRSTQGGGALGMKDSFAKMKLISCSSEVWCVAAG